MCVFSATLVLAIVTTSSPVAAYARVQGTQAKQIPSSLTNVGDYGENLYDLVKASDWPKAVDKFKALKEAAKLLSTDLKGADLKRLDTALTTLDKAVPAKDRQTALLQANQVTLIAADLVEPYNPPVPAAVTRLDHYGRELEIWAAARDSGKLKTSGDALRTTWDKLQPTVKARGGEAEAKKFSGLMTQVAAAKSVDDYAKLVQPILDEVDNLEKVFTKGK
jgi:hypothetical protein